MATKIVIQINGGIVTGIYSNVSDLQIVIVDHDLIDVGQNPVGDILSPDATADELHTLFTDNGPVETEIRDGLKYLKF